VTKILQSRDNTKCELEVGDIFEKKHQNLQHVVRPFILF
jgi:hypothetical protein